MAGLFDEAPPDPLDEIADRRRQRETERNARRRGNRAGHYCPCCSKRTYRRIRRMPTLGVVDERCTACVRLDAWPEQHTDRRRPDATIRKEATS